MGSSSSHHHLDPPLGMEQPLPYPDMNVIFKGIPKMMQVADDMHVMTQAITDMRNMTFALALMTLIGMILFLFIKYMQGRRRSRHGRRRLQNQIDSERSSLSRPYRQYPQKPLDWSPHHKVDMEKLLEHSSSSHGSQSQQHTPPAIASKRCGIMSDYNGIERTPPPIGHNSLHSTTNGSVLKPLNPVKLLIDEVPYVDMQGSSLD